MAHNTPPTGNATPSDNETTFHTDNPAANALLQDPGIKALMQSLVDSALEKNSKIHSPAGEPGSTGPTGAPGIDIGDNKLKSDEIGYFDPSAEGEVDYVTAGKHIIYRDVFAFTERLDLLTSQYEAEEVRKAIPGCLRGSALTWLSNELNWEAKECYKTCLVNVWTKSLAQRFKKRDAQSGLRHRTYGYSDLAKQSPREFANHIVRLFKAVDEYDENKQINEIYRALHKDLRVIFPEPGTQTLSEFLSKLDVMIYRWIALAQSRTQQSTRRPIPPVTPFRAPHKTPTWKFQPTSHVNLSAYYGPNAKQTVPYPPHSSAPRWRQDTPQQTPQRRSPLTPSNPPAANLSPNQSPATQSNPPWTANQSPATRLNPPATTPPIAQAITGPANVPSPPLSQQSDQANPFVCTVCHEAFLLNNRLHCHLKHICPGRSPAHAFAKEQEKPANQLSASQHESTSPATPPATLVRQRHPLPPASPSPTSTPPPTYRSVSPSPPAYKKPKSNDLFMRYAPLKSICPTTANSQSAPLANHTLPWQQRHHTPANQQRRQVKPTYLTIQDLFRMFKKSTAATAKNYGNEDKSMEIHGRCAPSVSGPLWQRHSKPATKLSTPEERQKLHLLYPPALPTTRRALLRWTTS